MFYSLFATLAYTAQNVQFEPQNPEGLTGSAAVTNNSIRQNSGLGTQDPLDITVGVINSILGILVIILVVLVVYAGFLWMTAGGIEDKIDKAKKILSATLIGLVIILVSYGATYFVFEVLLNVTSGPL